MIGFIMTLRLSTIPHSKDDGVNINFRLSNIPHSRDDRVYNYPQTINDRIPNLNYPQNLRRPNKKKLYILQKCPPGLLKPFKIMKCKA